MSHDRWWVLPSKPHYPKTLAKQTNVEGNKGFKKLPWKIWIWKLARWDLCQMRRHLWVKMIRNQRIWQRWRKLSTRKKRSQDPRTRKREMETQGFPYILLQIQQYHKWEYILGSADNTTNGRDLTSHFSK